VAVAALAETSSDVKAGKLFASPGEAVAAAVAAARNNDEKEFVAIFGSGGEELYSSGDEVSDQQSRERFLKAYDEKNSLVAEGENMILEVGNDAWPFPVPLVKKGESWFFDTVQGKDELLNRRIGRNELDTIQTCLAAVDAQREYALKARELTGTTMYAEKFESDPGKKNGLYWETKEGEEPSPLGLGVARAKAEGYDPSVSGDGPIAFHGYYYRLLKAQGPDAAGGAYDYVVNGKMIGGFAVLAYPADYGNSGVMSFMVNHDGIVYQKDLGDDTEKAAKEINAFNPDKSWAKVAESDQTEQ